MEIAHWQKGKTKLSGSGIMLRINKSEAIKIIKTLASQIDSGNCNDAREEFMDVEYNKNGKKSKIYFSISVSQL